MNKKTKTNGQNKHTQMKHNKKACISCRLELDKLKKLCQQKGLQTSFTNGKCPKHKKDKTIVVYYKNCKCDKLIKQIQNSITKALYLGLKKMAKAKKHHKIDPVRELDEFIVEDVDDIIKSETSSDLIQFGPPIITVDDQSDLNDTEIFIKPNLPTAKATKPPYACQEQDSLGLFQFTQNTDELKPLDNVKTWTLCGHPYINDMHESEYDFPVPGGANEGSKNWISPGLSPILA